MGSWGVKALESDEGLDILYEFRNYCVENDKVIIGDLIEYFKEIGLLPKNSEEIDFLYDKTVMALAELLKEYNEKGEMVVGYKDGGEKAVEEKVTDLMFNREDIDYLINQITNILEPKGEVHETYELWKDSKNFSKWEEHVRSLLAVLKGIKDNL